MSTYFGILTKVGEAKEASAKARNTPLRITEMEVGDGAGTVPTPDREQSALIASKRRAPVNRVFVDPKNPSWLIVEQVIPEEIGGWWIRELGLRDADGDLVAVANCPPTYKPKLAEGSGRTQVLRMVLLVTSTTHFTLSIDPSVVLATREYVDAQVLEVKLAAVAKDHTHAIAQVVGLQTALDGKAPTSHFHSVAQILGLQTILDGKAVTVHTHSITQVTGLQVALDGKAASNHSHSISQVTGLQNALNAKAASSHTHEIANVNGLQTALNGKAASSHSHAWSQITGTPGILGQGQSWQWVSRTSGTTYTNTTGKPIMVLVRSTGDASSTSATITINGVDLLQSSYNGRSASVCAVVPSGVSYRTSAYPGIYVCELR